MSTLMQSRTHVPVSWFSKSAKKEMLDSCPSSDGTEPVNLLPKRPNEDTVVSSPSCVGTVPRKLQRRTG
jgi:hypothetical protein